MTAALSLATTNLKRSWPAAGPDIFLGDWCFQSRDEARAYPRSVVAPYPWSPHEARTEGLNYCVGLTMRVAKGLRGILANQLQETLDDREISLVCAATLGRIVMAAYHDFICLKSVTERYRPLKTAGLQSKDYVVPETTERLIDMLRRDDFRLQFISELCPALDVALENCSRGNIDLEPPPLPNGRSDRPQRGSASLLRQVAKSILRRQARLADCILYNPSFSLTETMLLIVRSGFRIGYVHVANLNSINWPKPAPELREIVAGELASVLRADVFEQALAKIIAMAFPVSLLEGLGQLRSFVAKHFPRPAKVIASGISWNNDDAFRLWALEGRKQGSLLLGCQHGGAYDTRFLPDIAERLERLVVDRFISWGGSGQAAGTDVAVPTPPHFLEKRAAKSGDYMLYIGTTIDRWTFSIAHWPVGPMFWPYFERQIEFCRALPAALQDKLLFRPNPVSAGWSEISLLRRRLPDARIDDFSRSFSSRVSKATLAVVDNLNTTFMQCLASGVPTILVWDPEAWATDAVATAHFKRLEAAGVFFRCPKAAAEAAARVWPDPRKWWKEPPVAAAVKTFLDQYMKRDRDWLGPWLRELLPSAPMNEQTALESR